MPSRMLALQSDARLLELHDRGDQRAFEVIVRRYRRELLAYCKRLGLSDARAEDALQQAFLNAWVALQRGTEVRELRAWLRRIVHNAALNVIRGAGQDRALDLDLDAALVDPASATESSLAGRLSAREALADVAALPAMQRDAILLSAVEGRTHDEVASALGVSPVAVRGLLYRARATLRAGAGALTPAPLLGWISQATSRLACMTDGAGLGGEGFNLPRALLEGTAVLATAAVATGAVLGHSHTHPTTQGRSPRPLARVLAPGRPSTELGSPAHRESSHLGRAPSSRTSIQPGRAQSGAGTTVGARTKTSPANRLAAPVPATGRAVAGGGEAPQTVAATTSGAGTPSGETPAAPTEPTPTPTPAPEPTRAPEEKSGSGGEKGDEGEAAREAEEEAAERRTELQEHEAERERELAESEAEKAREAREEEADH